jgi:hypothetical protein
MPRYVIERQLRGIGDKTVAEYRDIAAASNAVLRQLGPEVQWVESFVTADKLYCIYQAANEAVVREHAERGGFPCDSVARVHGVIGPHSAE